MLNLNDNTLVIDLPEGAWEPRMSVKRLNHFIYRMGETEARYIDLPPGEWEIFTPTEEDADQLVSKSKMGEYLDYVAHKTSLGKYGAYFYFNALESLRSLVESNNINNPVYLRKK
jgi:hypothetical protein